MADFRAILFGEEGLDGEIVSGLDSLARDPQLQRLLLGLDDDWSLDRVEVGSRGQSASVEVEGKNGAEVCSDAGETAETLDKVPWLSYEPISWLERCAPKIALELFPVRKNPVYPSVHPDHDVYLRDSQLRRKRRKLERACLTLNEQVPPFRSSPKDEETRDEPPPQQTITRELPTPEKRYLAVSLDPWERDVLYEPPESGTAAEDRIELDEPGFIDDRRNEALEIYDWENQIHISDSSDFGQQEFDRDKRADGGAQPNQFLPLEVNDSDAKLWLRELTSTEEAPDDALPVERWLQSRFKEVMSLSQGQTATYGRPAIPFDPLVLSKDHYYDEANTRQVPMVRQALGSQSLSHSLPAVKLYSQYYKTHLSRYELRRYHRMPIKLQPGLHIRISPLKYMAIELGTKMRGRNIKAKHLTVKDKGSRFVLFEFCEEYPPLMQKLGMACIIHWYWRRDPDSPDIDPPKPPGPGSLFVLEPEDASPFLGFGEVHPGQLVPAIYNNLFRAPIFQHKANRNEFLLVRHLNKGSTRFYLRKLDTIFVVGQTLPLQEVPTPHARKVIDIIRKRLQHLVFQILKYKQKQGNVQIGPRTIRFSTVREYFPGIQEAQLKIRLKEFTDWSKKTDQYSLRPAIAVPTDDELRALISPEMVCLYESMLVGQQMLKDSGYGNIDPEGDDEVEVQSAPWNLSKNFLNACQGKGVLKLVGAGDPTGKAGEGFSFFKSSLKEMWFSRDGEKYSVAEQQAMYRREIERIWKAQASSLSRAQEPVYTNEPVEDDDDTTSLGILKGQKKMLVIQRKYVDQNTGHETWRQEIVRDPRVINAYLRRRKAAEADEAKSLQQTVASSVAAQTPPPGQDPMTLEKMRLTEEIQRLKKSMQRKIQRENLRNRQMALLQQISGGPAQSLGTPSHWSERGDSESAGALRSSELVEVLGGSPSEAPQKRGKRGRKTGSSQGA